MRVKYRTGRIYTSRIKLPIYSVNLYFGMADTAKIAHDHLVKQGIFGAYDGEFWALCSYNKAKFGIFFGLDDKSVGTLAHEVFHMTHRILEFTGCRFDSGGDADDGYQNHEHAALLHGTIFEWAEDNHKEAIKRLAKS